MTTYTLFAPGVPLSNSQVPSTVSSLNPQGLNAVSSLSASTPFSFQPTLDGNQYNVTITWNFFGQRYYVNCKTLTGSLVFNLPLVGSEVGLAIQSISWNSGTATVTTATMHGFSVGSVLNLSMTDTVPTAYNGNISATVINGNQFTYLLSGFPGSVTFFGNVSYDVNIAAGYFNSTLIYRTANQQFEVTP